MNSVAPRTWRDRLSALSLGVLPFIVGFVLVLALPRLIEGLVALPGNAALESIRNGHFDRATIDTLLTSRERALAVVERGRSRRDAAAGRELLAIVVPMSPEEKIATLDRALADARRAVSESPADAFAWYRLAAVMFARDGASESAVRAVFQSIRLGPYETELMAPRLELLFGARSYLVSDTDTDAVVDDQIRVAWKRNWQDIVRAARHHGAGDIVKRALERKPPLVTNLDDYLADPKTR